MSNKRVPILELFTHLLLLRLGIFLFVAVPLVAVSLKVYLYYWGIVVVHFLIGKEIGKKMEISILQGMYAVLFFYLTIGFVVIVWKSNLLAIAFEAMVMFAISLVTALEVRDRRK